MMIKNGVLKNPDVDFIFGMHIWSDVPVKKAIVCAAAVMQGLQTLVSRKNNGFRRFF